jgi:hypothetical protein
MNQRTRIFDLEPELSDIDRLADEALAYESGDVTRDPTIPAEPMVSLSEMAGGPDSVELDDDQSVGYLLEYGPFGDLERRITQSFISIGESNGSQKALLSTRDAVQAFREGLHAAVLAGGPALTGEELDVEGSVAARRRALTSANRYLEAHLRKRMDRLGANGANTENAEVIRSQMAACSGQIEDEVTRYERALADSRNSTSISRLFDRVSNAAQSMFAGATEDLSPELLRYRGTALRSQMSALEGAYAEIMDRAGDPEWEADTSSRGARGTLLSFKKARDEVETLTKGLERHLRDGALSERLDTMNAGLAAAAERTKNEELSSWMRDLAQQILAQVRRMLAALGIRNNSTQAGPGLAPGGAEESVSLDPAPSSFAPPASSASPSRGPSARF